MIQEPLHLCINCRHHVLTDAVPKIWTPGQRHECRLTGKVNLVDGSTTYRSCESERVNSGDCGPKGELFEEKT